MSSISRLKSTSLQNNIHIVNDGPIDSNTDDKAAYAVGCGYNVNVMVTTSCPLIRSQIQSQYPH